MQLDIFEHSRDVMLRSDVVVALQRRDASAARSAWQALCKEFPADASSAPLDVLVSALERRDPSAFADHDAARAARLALQDKVAPAAARMLGAEPGAAWLAPLWRDLAERAAALPFRADHAENQAAPLWLRAGDAQAAIDATLLVESWRRIPAPLAWMAEARHRVSGLATAWPLLAELAWLSPARFDALTKRLGDPTLAALRRRFDASFEGDGDSADLAWFPAWVLTDKPALAPLLAEAQPSLDTPPEQALWLLLELLRLERQGRHHDIVARRKRLRSIGPALYGAYMKTR